MKKVLLYSHDTYGLGNSRRMLTIARHLVSMDETISILIVSGSPMQHTFRHGHRIDYIKLPCLARTANSGYSSRYLECDTRDLVRLRSNLILSAMIDFQPDLVLVDKKPMGVRGELGPAIEIMQRRVPGPKFVLLLRDILDSPEVTARLWRDRGHFKAVERYYENILVVGSQDVFDVACEYRFPRGVADKVRYCGYLGRESGRRTDAEVRCEYGLPAGRLVLAMAGGGEDGAKLLTTWLEAVIKTGSALPCHSLLVCGPEMPGRDCKHIQVMARDLPQVTVINFTDDLMSLIETADVVVSMGGYNTICEILTAKKPAIIIPRVTPVEEQWIRARKLQQRGLVSAIHPARLSADRLMAAVNSSLLNTQSLNSGLPSLDLNGLQQIGGYVRALLADAQGAHTLNTPGVFGRLFQ